MILGSAMAAGLVPTGLGQSIAIPHGKSPAVEITFAVVEAV